MRLLMLLPFAPRRDATNGGARVLTHFLSEITARHTVAILYFREAGEPGADPFFHERCEWVEEVIRPASKKSLLERLARYLRILISLCFLRPVWVGDWASAEFAKRARLLVQKFQPEIIQLELHVMGQYLSALGDCSARRVLVEYEASARAALYLQNLPWVLRGLFRKMEQIAWQRYERKIYRHVDAIVVFTEADQRSISQSAMGTSIHIIHPGTTIPEFPVDPLGGPVPSLLFVGNFYHPPNADAARRLTDSIFPAVRRLFPDAKLFIVGEHPPVDLHRSDHDRVIVTGRVPDITPYLDQAALFVAPLRLGGGMRIKILESLAAGKAIIATSLATEGLDIQDGQQVVIAESDDEFVEQIVDLIHNPDKRLAIAQRARGWACRNITWEQSVVQYETLYQKLLTSSANREETWQ